MAKIENEENNANAKSKKRMNPTAAPQHQSIPNANRRLNTLTTFKLHGGTILNDTAMEEQGRALCTHSAATIYHGGVLAAPQQSEKTNQAF